eukprot:s1495_g13.t1
METDVQAAYAVQVLEVPTDVNDLDGQLQAVALVVLRRRTGFLLAVPKGAFSDGALAAGLVAPSEDMIGQSVVIQVPAGIKISLEDVAAPEAEEGTLVEVVLIDVTNEMGRFVAPFNPDLHQPDLLFGFAEDNVHLMPMPDPLSSLAWDWVQNPASGDRALFYSAAEEEGDEVPETPPRGMSPETSAPLPPRRQPTSRGTQPRGGDPGGQKKVKPTVATLAASLESISGTLPALMDQFTELKLRQEAMEQKLSGSSSTRPAALQQPLSSFVTPGFASSSQGPASLLRQMPPPRSTMIGATHPSKLSASPAEVGQLAEDKELTEEPNDLAKAVYAQSQALTALVAHLTNADPIHDLSSSSGLSTKGAAGRMKLQQELAQHKGTFFAAILHNMARRMQPAQAAEQSPQELRARGITPTSYVERYGGFGRNRELGSLMWQVAMILDHLQSDNVNAAKDATALLAVCLEQAALDSGKMDLALLLSLTEDPPAGVFTNRSLAGVTRGRAFAPLAEQRWVTTALAFVKEMDLIQSKRQDVGGGKTEKTTPDNPGPKKVPKKKPKGGGKSGQNQKEEDE